MAVGAGLVQVLFVILHMVNAQQHCTGGSLCQNGGTCVDTLTSTRCLCMPGYGGPTCAEVQYCSSDPCGQHGSCVEESTGGYSCDCQSDFLGLNCELPVNKNCDQAEESFCVCEVDGSPVKVPIPPAAPEREKGPHRRDFLMGLAGLALGWVLGACVAALCRFCCHGDRGCCGKTEAVVRRRPRPYPRNYDRPTSAETTLTGVDNISIAGTPPFFYADSPVRHRPAPHQAADFDFSATGGRDGGSGPGVRGGGGGIEDGRGGERGGGGPEGSGLSSGRKRGIVNVYRAGFSDTMAHQTASRKSGSTYTSGSKDW